MVNSTWDGWIILARVSQIREIFPDELDDPMPGSSSNSPYAQIHILDRRLRRPSSKSPPTKTSTQATITATRTDGRAPSVIWLVALCAITPWLTARDITHPVELTRFGDALQGVRPVAF